MGSGEKFEKNVTAIPRQFGYLETGRAMYEYAFYKDEEVAHARGRPPLWEPFRSFRNRTICVWPVRSG